MRIVICDDERDVAESLARMIRKYGVAKGRDMEILSFVSGESLIQWCAQERLEVHLLLLDVEMEGMSGLEVKEYMKNMDEIRRIIILTKHREAMAMSFGLKVVGFLEKPLPYDKLEKLIDVIWEELEEKRIITYRIGNAQFEIPSKEIIYVTAIRGYTVFVDVCGKTTSSISCKMKEWEKMLEGLPFVRVHKSYIVNLEYIADFRKKISLHYLEIKIPVGRSYRNQTKQTYEEYLAKKIRRRLL